MHCLLPFGSCTPHAPPPSPGFAGTARNEPPPPTHTHTPPIEKAGRGSLLSRLSGSPTPTPPLTTQSVKCLNFTELNFYFRNYCCSISNNVAYWCRCTYSLFLVNYFSCMDLKSKRGVFFFFFFACANTLVLYLWRRLVQHRTETDMPQCYYFLSRVSNSVLFPRRVRQRLLPLLYSPCLT